MEKNFTRPTSIEPIEWSAQNNLAELFIADVKKTGHFDFDSKEEEHVKFDYLKKTGRWYDVVNIYARITIEGLAYLENQKTNETIKRNSVYQTIAIGLTVFFTLITVIYTILSYTSGMSKEQLLKQLQMQTQQIHTLQIQLSQSISNSQKDHDMKVVSKKN